MKRFLLKVSAFSVVVIIFFAIIFAQTDGYSDPFYIRFTTPKQNNLILGTSRAAQGLQPDIFNQILKTDFYNYAFTVSHSPYGPTYLKSIEKKLKKNTHNGTFIVTIDPWSISSTTHNPNDSINFGEKNLCLGNTPIVNMNPNYLYIINNLNLNVREILNKDDTSMFLHHNGWLEVDIKMDSISVNRRIKQKFQIYREKNLAKFNFSSFRLEYLKKTILYLNQYGSVYLVRLPVHENILEIEEQYMPDFDTKIEGCITLTKGYLDMTPHHNRYQYTDGNHIYKESGKIVSKEVAEWISRNP